MPNSKQQQQQPPSSDLFKIPILPPPLLPTWNIPAPVIHPPGSDPGLFTNRNQVLTMACPMDVDPCVMGLKREEIVAKDVDLTASEQAGVTLSEATTTVPATFGYPTNTAVVAPQTVKDVIVTQTESKNTNFIVCDVGNVTCNSDKAFKKHMEGKVHLKNTQKPTINQETPSPVANATLDQESEKKKKNTDLDITQKLLVSTAIEQQTPSSVANDTSGQKSEKKNQELWQKEAAGGSLFDCDIPEPGINYPKIATVEMDETVFKNLVPNPASVSRTPVSSTQNRPTKLGVHKPIWCDVCKVNCNTGKIFDQHIAGKQHQKNLKILKKAPTSPWTTIVTSMDTTPVTKPMQKVKSTESELGVLEDSKITWCEICKVSCSSKGYEEHTTGMKHRNNLQKLKKMQHLPSTITKGEVVNPNDGNSAKCELCGVCCTSPDMFYKHISGKKHQKNLKKSGKQCVPSPAPVAKTLLSEPTNEEGEVVLSEKSKRKAGDPLTSDDDADTKRQNMGEEEGRRVLVICKVCNVGCDGLMAFNTHLASFEHLTMALKHARGGSNGLQV